MEGKKWTLGTVKSDSENDIVTAVEFVMNGLLVGEEMLCVREKERENPVLISVVIWGIRGGLLESPHIKERWPNQSQSHFG